MVIGLIWQEDIYIYIYVHVHTAILYSEVHRKPTVCSRTDLQSRILAHANLKGNCQRVKTFDG